MVKTDFQTQSPQQSIFLWQRKSVGAGSLGYERRNISISLFNSLWHPAYVSLGTVWDIVNRRQGCAWKGNGGMKSPELANRLREKKNKIKSTEFVAAVAVKLQGKSRLSAQLDFHAEIMSKRADRAWTADWFAACWEMATSLSALLIRNVESGRCFGGYVS